MYSSWFDLKVLQDETKRIEEAQALDDMFEQFEGMDVEDGEEEKEEEQKPVFNRERISDGNFLRINGASIWKRPAPFIFKPQDFLFQHIDTTQGMDRKDGGPSIHLWGCTSEGHSVAVINKSFRPYFYARITNQADARFIHERLDLLLQNKTSGGGDTSSKILSMEPVKKISLCGWSEGRDPDPMYKITMVDCTCINRARKALDYGNRFVVPHGVPVQTFEANVQFELRYMVDHQMSGCQWIKLKQDRYSPVLGSKKITEADYEFLVDSHHQSLECVPVKERGDIAPVRLLCFDIECKKRNGGSGFVRAEEDPVICICAELEVYGKGTIHRVAFCYVEKPDQKVDPIPYDESKGELPVTVFVFHYEFEMFLAFSQYIREADPDAFTGWNIAKFDFPYLFKRAAILSISNDFLRFTRMVRKVAKIREVVVQSKAFGMKKMCETTCEGRFVYDALDFMTFGQMQKFRSYTLNSMSRELLGDEKVDVHYTQIGPLHDGSDKDRARLIYYCCVDSQLPLKILKARMGLVNGIEQARVTGVPIKWILGGQGRKTFSNVLRYKLAHEVVPTRSPKMNAVHTKGGLVRKPIVGYYTTPIVTLDFASLYPSIMQAFNICYSTVCTAARANELIRMGKYTRDDFEWPPSFGNDFCFVKPHIRLGVLPDLLTQLLAQRAFVKGLMKGLDKVKDKDLLDVLDNRQLALKLCCNSVYGFLKAFILVDPRLMSAVTDWGQDMIKETADIVLTHYKDNEIVDRKECERLGIDFENVPPEGQPDPRPKMKYTPRIIYGDSVTPTTPVLLRIQPSGLLRYVNIEDVPRKTEWVHYEDEKETAIPEDGIEIWSDQGFTPLLNIIRHKTQKRIFRVLTHTGCVSVTEDHSLLLPNGKEVKPTEVNVGDTLMHKDLPMPQIEQPVPSTMGAFFAMGLFFADGNCNETQGKNRKNYTWKISKHDVKLLEKARDDLNTFFKDYTFKIYDGMETSDNSYNIKLYGKDRVSFIRLWRKWFYTDRKQKKVPDEILNAPIEHVRLFMEGYYAGDGYKKEGNYQFDNKGEIGTAGLAYLITRLGMTPTYGTRSDKLQIYRVRGLTGPLKRPANAIKKIEDLGNSNDYVYDLTTGNHHFAAGIGNLVVHNTDSIMVDFGNIGLQDAVRLQKEAAKLCTSKMKTPNKLEPESVKLRSDFMAPKMYASLEILTGDVKPTDRLEDACKRAKISCKGLQSKRRDNALIGSENQYECLEAILKRGDIQGAIDIVKKNISDVLMDRVDLSKLVISKGLSKTDAEYKKGGTKQLHTSLKERMAARAKTTGELVPETGDRVPFIMRSRYKGEQSSECSEDPIYAQKNRIPIDKTYYIDKQIRAGTLKLFTSIWEPERVSEVKSSMSEKKMRTLRAYQELFAPSLPHMLQKKERKIGGVQGIESHLVALPQCLYMGCGVLLSQGPSSHILCKEHLDCYDEAQSLLDEKMEALERIRDAAWARCRKCAGGGFDEVTCANTTCDNYFHRDRAIMDIEDLEKDIVTFKRNKPKQRVQTFKGDVQQRTKEKEIPVEKAKKLKNTDISRFFAKK